MEKDFPHRKVVAGIVLLLAGGLSACTSLADRITSPGSSALIDVDSQTAVEDHLDMQRRRHRTGEGLELVYRTVPAVDYGFEYEYRRTDDGFAINFATAHTPEERSPVPQRGTVIFLHGWSMDSSSMLPWALSLAEAGYAGITVDLRNHGSSGQAPAGFGPREGGDIADLTTSLLAQGGIKPPLYLLGVSYGAVVALHAADLLGGDVKAVVAIAPYANAADGVRDMIKGSLDMQGQSLRARASLAFARWRYDSARIDAAMATAQQRLDLDLAAIDVREPVARMRACALVLHGTDDGFFPIEAAQSLADASARAQLHALENEHHFTAPMRVDWLAEPIADWLHAVSAPDCARFELPPPPDAAVPV